jgi:two-component system cell cycle sensor histidine kinase PleC
MTGSKTDTTGLDERDIAELDAGILRDALEDLADGFVLFDERDRLVLCNRRYRDIYHPVGATWTPGATLESIARDTARACFGFEDERDVEAYVRSRVQRFHGSGTGSLLQHMADDRWIQVNERRLPNGWSVGIRTDVTALKRSEMELQASLERAEAAAAAKSVFFAKMSHEIRTPLNAILGFSGVMADHTFGPIGNKRYEGYVEDIRQSAEYLRGLLDNLLEMARDPSADPAWGQAPGDCDAVTELSFCLRQVLSSAAARKQSLDARGRAESYPIALPSDAFRQITTNLLVNALKFSPDGATVSVRLRPAPGDRIALTVADRGPGIAQADLARLMLPFEQGAAKAEGHPSGVGLGLAIITGLCERHGATFRLRAREGKGTVARVTMPRA